MSCSKMHLELIFILGFNLAIIPVHTFAQVSEPHNLQALKTDKKPELDGQLNEACWQQAVRISNFHQRETEEGRPATERTEIAAVYTREAIYFGVWCYDSQPQNITAKEMKRDFKSYVDDNLEIIIDTYHDYRNGYHFVINPNGARRDELVTDEGRGRNSDWNGVWDAKAAVTDKGWFAEIEIPFSTLKFPETSEQVWGINFERNIKRNQEQVLWQGWSRDYYLEQVSQAGLLTGLREISGGHLLEFKPYVTAGAEKHVPESVNGLFHVGGDIDYLLSSNLKLNITANTDFAQIESDRSVINLTRYSIYYPEKRNFFLEGRDAFSFGRGKGLPYVFYTRRIGIKDNGQVPILGGVRLMGKAKGTNIGALSILTSAKDGEPMANYSVVRLKQDVAGQSNIGMIATARNTSKMANYVYGVDANYVTSHLFGDKNLAFGGALTQSYTRNAEHSRGLAYQMYLRSHNDKFEYDFAYAGVQKEFDPQVGFMRRDNYKLLYSELQFNPRPDFLPGIRQMEIKPVDVDAYFTDDTNELESLGMEWRPLGFESQSGEFFEYNIQRFYDRLDEPFEISDGVVLPVGGYWYNRQEIQLETYRGRKVSVGAQVSWGDYYSGKRGELAMVLRANVNRHLNFSGDYEYNHLKFPQGTFSTHEWGGRIEYAFTTKMYTSFFGQWNNDDEEFLLNMRLNWIPQIGSDFYLAVNELLDTKDGRIRVQDVSILTKLVWRFVL